MCGRPKGARPCHQSGTHFGKRGAFARMVSISDLCVLQITRPSDEVPSSKYAARPMVAAARPQWRGHLLVGIREMVTGQHAADVSLRGCVRLQLNPRWFELSGEPHLLPGLASIDISTYLPVAVRAFSAFILGELQGVLHQDGI